MDTEAKAVIKEYEKEMVEYPAKMKKYEAKLKLFDEQQKTYKRAIEGRMRVVLHVGPYRDEDVFNAMVTEKGCRELIATIGKHHVVVEEPREPREPSKPCLCVSYGCNNSPF